MISAFFAGKDLRFEFIKTQLFCDGCGGGLIVARCHHQADPLLSQFAQAHRESTA